MCGTLNNFSVKKGYQLANIQQRNDCFLFLYFFDVIFHTKCMALINKHIGETFLTFFDNVPCPSSNVLVTFQHYRVPSEFNLLDDKDY